MNVSALDIGGANIKGATHAGTSFSEPFALWRTPEQLSGRLESIVRERLGRPQILAVTMTGELCDCYPTKSAGVAAILDAVEHAVSAAAPGCRVLVWTTTGALSSLADARQRPLDAAAANWLATAWLAARLVPRGTGLLLDVGSTTTDLVPLLEGEPAPRALSDTERLLAGELVYVGAARTPVCALVRTLPWRGSECPVSAELFATTLDAHILAGDVPGSEDTCHTADGKPADRAHSHTRLARMLCADPDTLGPAEAAACARRVLQAEEAAILEALRRWPRAPRAGATAVTCGSGEHVARRVAEAIGARVVSLGAELGPGASCAAPAVALATLAAERAASGA